MTSKPIGQRRVRHRAIGALSASHASTWQPSWATWLMKLLWLAGLAQCLLVDQDNLPSGLESPRVLRITGNLPLVFPLSASPDAA